MIQTEERRLPEGNRETAGADQERGRSTGQHSAHRRRDRTTPWGELYGTLLAAEAEHRGLTKEQHRDNVERRARQAVDLMDAVHEENQLRRERVLRHPDLAERLASTLRLSRASHWNGFVPPRTSVELACGACSTDRRAPCRREHAAAANLSPTRAQVVQIAREALRREGGT